MNDTTRTGYVDRDTIPTDQYSWGIIKWLVTPDKDNADHTLGEVVVRPGLGHDRHNHPDAEEVLYFLSGTGLQMVDDGEPYEVHAGDIIYIPKGVFHSTTNTGWDTLRVLALYNPGGSEKELQALPDYVRVEPGETARLG